MPTSKHVGWQVYQISKPLIATSSNFLAADWFPRLHLDGVVALTVCVCVCVCFGLPVN